MSGAKIRKNENPLRPIFAPGDAARAGQSGPDISEDALQVAARLAASLDHSDQIVLVTGYDDRDHAPDMAAQLALALARVSRAQVALIDGQKEAASLHELFGIEQGPGLGDVLRGTADLTLATREVASGVFLMPAGDSRSPMSGPDCERLCRQLREGYRYIVIAARPLLFAAEAITLGSISDGVVLVIRQGLHNREQVQELQREIARMKLKLFGAVLREGK